MDTFPDKETIGPIGQVSPVIDTAPSGTVHLVLDLRFSKDHAQQSIQLVKPGSADALHNGANVAVRARLWGKNLSSIEGLRNSQVRLDDLTTFEVWIKFFREINDFLKKNNPRLRPIEPRDIGPFTVQRGISRFILVPLIWNNEEDETKTEAGTRRESDGVITNRIVLEQIQELKEIINGKEEVISRMQDKIAEREKQVEILNSELEKTRQRAQATTENLSEMELKVASLQVRLSQQEKALMESNFGREQLGRDLETKNQESFLKDSQIFELNQIAEQKLNDCVKAQSQAEKERKEAIEVSSELLEKKRLMKCTQDRMQFQKEKKEVEIGGVSRKEEKRVTRSELQIISDSERANDEKRNIHNKIRDKITRSGIKNKWVKHYLARKI